MGTKGLTVIEDRDGKEICVLYRQYDSYPDAHGKELAKFLCNFTVVNGYGGDTKNVANGMECLAAQIIAHFKKECGNFYLYPAGTRDWGEDFIYKVHQESQYVKMALITDEVIFDGSPSEFITWVNNGGRR